MLLLLFLLFVGVVDVVDPTNLPLKFGKLWSVTAEILLVVGGGLQSNFCVNLTYVMLD